MVPVAWQKLFDLLLNQSMDTALCWYKNECGSLYGRQMYWHQLFASLSIRDPVIVSNTLMFQPRFYHFPAKLQHKFLIFLIHISYMVSDQELANFVKVLEEQLKHCTTTVQHLLKELNSKLPVQYLQTNDEKVQEVTEHTQMETILSSEGPESKTKPDVIVIDDDDDEPSLKYRRLDREETSDPDIVKDVNKDTTADEIETSINDETKLQFSQISFLDSHDELDLNVSNHLPAGVEKVKEIWHAGFVCELDEYLKQLIEMLSDQQVEEFCEYVDFQSMGDDSLEIVWQHICSLCGKLSFGCIQTFMNFALAQQVKELKQNASRKLMNTVSLIADTCPKQLIDSVFIPCLQVDDILPAHVDLLSRFIKESSNADSRSYFIQQLTRHDIKLSEGNIPVFHAVLDTSSALDAQTYTKLVTLVSDVAALNVKSLKFGKLVLAFVNKHGHSLNNSTVEILKSVASRHNTFLKKTLLTALNKIKVN